MFIVQEIDKSKAQLSTIKTDILLELEQLSSELRDFEANTQLNAEFVL